MTKYFILFLLSLLSHLFVLSQYVNLSDNCKETHTTSYSRDVSTETMLPEKVQKILKIILEKRLADMRDSLKFKVAHIYTLDSLEWKNNLQALADNPVIPKYEIIYQLSIAKTHALPVCIKVQLDPYCQVLSVDWPRYRYRKDAEFKEFYFLKKRAESYALSKKYGSTISSSRLIYDGQDDEIYYEFLFRIEKEDKKIDNFSKRNAFRSISVNIKTIKVEKDYLIYKDEITYH